MKAGSKHLSRGIFADITWNLLKLFVETLIMCQCNVYICCVTFFSAPQFSFPVGDKTLRNMWITASWAEVDGFGSVKWCSRHKPSESLKQDAGGWHTELITRLELEGLLTQLMHRRPGSAPLRCQARVHQVTRCRQLIWTGLAGW